MNYIIMVYLAWNGGRRKVNPYLARAVRGHAGPGHYITKKRQSNGDKRDLEYLNNGGHLSIGLTKKRQEQFDMRDKKSIQSRLKDPLYKKKKRKKINR